MTSAASSSSAAAASRVAAASRDATGWYAANDQVYQLELTSAYSRETHLVVGTGPASSTAGFDQLESDINPGDRRRPGHIQVQRDGGRERARPARGRGDRGVPDHGRRLRLGLNRRLREYQ